MTNPLTAYIQSNMETQSSREFKFEDRVARTAISSQQLSDERHGPGLPHNYWQKDRSADFNRYYTAVHAYKGQVGGRPNSFEAANFYSDMAVAKRDALLKEVASENA